MTKGARNFIFYGIIIAVIAGGFCGALFGEKMTHIDFIGDFFINALRMIVVPLVVASIIVGISSLGDVRKIGKTGMLTLLLYLSTTLIAVVIGIIMVRTIDPGDGFVYEGEKPELSAEQHAKLEKNKSRTSGETLKDLFLSLAPKNIIKAAAETKVLPLIIFSLFLGGILTTLGPRGEAVLRFFVGFNEAIMKLVQLLMFIAPLGIFALVAAKLGSTGGGAAFWNFLKQLGWYATAVLIGLAVHALVILPLLLSIVGRRNPFKYAGGMAPALLTAFSTASSSATLPITMESITERNKVRKDVSDFVLPLGATINMDGTALYEAVAAIFIGTALWPEFNPSLGALIVVALTATLASIGAAGIPEAGLFTMVIVFTALGFPEKVIIEGLAIILVIDWFLDRCRTTVNVWGDSVVTAAIDRLTTAKSGNA